MTSKFKAWERLGGRGDSAAVADGEKLIGFKPKEDTPLLRVDQQEKNPECLELLRLRSSIWSKFVLP